MSSDQTLTISIAMATFNGGRYLREQLESFEAQTLLPDEIIMSDDCSADDTLQIINTFKLKSSLNIIVNVNKSRLGFVQNFSKAISLCTGDLIFMSDQDDIWFPTKIEYIAGIAQRRPDISLFINDALITFDDLATASGSMIDRRFSDGLSLSTHLTNGCQTAVRRSFALMMIPIPEQVRAHDIWFHDFARYLGVKLIVPKVLQYWRRHDLSTCGFPALSPPMPLRLLTFMHHCVFGFESPVPCLEVKRTYLLLLLKLLTDRYENLDQSKVCEAQKLIQDELHLNIARLKALEKFGLRKLLGIFGNYFKGLYKLDGGLKSAIKDFCSVSYSAR
jgi:glycosyltransferase involved in cell wall biosynthesis